MDENRINNARGVRRVACRVRSDREWLDQFSRRIFRGAEGLTRAAWNAVTEPLKCYNRLCQARENHPQPGGRLPLPPQTWPRRSPGTGQRLVNHKQPICHYVSSVFQPKSVRLFHDSLVRRTIISCGVSGHLPMCLLMTTWSRARIGLPIPECETETM